MTVKISQENGKAVVSVDGNEALKADAAGNVEVVGDLAVQGLVAADVNGLWVGLGGGDSSSNTAIGLGSLSDNTTGNNNAANGRLALSNNTTGAENVAVGSLALVNNTTGSKNIAIGRQALSVSVSGNRNTGVGFTAAKNMTGSNNTVLGSFTGNQNGIDITDTNNNIAIADGGGKVSFFKDSSDNVHLRTGNENRLTVQPSGNVSIANDLEVEGEVALNTFSKVGQLTVAGVGTTGTYFAGGTNINNHPNRSLQLSTFPVSNVQHRGHLITAGNSNESGMSLQLGVSGAAKLTIKSNGNVSIANDLEVNGTTIAALIARIEALEAGN